MSEKERGWSDDPPLGEMMLVYVMGGAMLLVTIRWIVDSVKWLIGLF